MDEKPGWSEELMPYIKSTINGNIWKHPGMKGNSLKSPEMALTRNGNSIQIFATFPSMHYVLQIFFIHHVQ